MAKLAINTKQAIITLAKKGTSRRAIARILKVNRYVIEEVLTGINEQRIPCHSVFGNVATDYKRCPECGGLVLLPCTLCAIRRTKANASV